MRGKHGRQALAALVALSVAPPAVACPAYVPAQSVDLPIGKRSEVRLFARTGDAWTALPLQVDALDEKGVLKAPPERGDGTAGDPGFQLVSPLDRIALRVESFGAKAAAGAPAPCKAARAVELEAPGRDGQPRYGYLTVCEDAAADVAALPVSHDVAHQNIKAPRFEYSYQPNNQLMYRSLIAKSPAWTTPALAAANADLNLHLDIKKFFTMDFTNADVESFVGQTSVGPVGMVGSIDFFLHLLFFKINLKMGTTVGFYADSAHIPAVIDVPRDAPKMLHPGSGILYTWGTRDAAIDQTKPAETMPNADAPRALAGWEAQKATGLAYCNGDPCVFRLRGVLRDEHFALDVNVPKNMVERGFYPQWVGDVAAFKKAMGWDDDPKDPPGTVAVFFDNGGLPQGQYKIDQWIKIGQPAEVAATCPRAVRTLGNVSFGPSTIAH